MSVFLTRYHVTVGDKRTTVSLDRTLTELLAVKLGQTPDAPQAQQMIRLWLQQQLDHANDPGRDRLSQWLQEQALFEIVDRSLYERHAQWLLADLNG